MPRHHDVRWPVEDGPDDQSDADDTLQSGGAADIPNTDTYIRSPVFTEPEPENRRTRRRRVRFAVIENQLLATSTQRSPSLVELSDPKGPEATPSSSHHW